MKVLLTLIFSIGYLIASPAFISATNLKAKLDQKNLVILDVTDKTTYKAGHIPNAINIDVFKFRTKVQGYQLMKSSAEVQAIARSLGINNNSKLVIYGHGKPKELLKSSYVALALLTNGLKNISILDGGYSDWLYENPELTSTKTSTIIKGNFIAKHNPDILIDINYVQNNLHKIDMIESRPKVYYDGEKQSSGVRRLGHIPGSKSSFWKDKFDSEDSVLSKSNLEEIYLKDNKLNKNNEVIVYCTGGLEASMNWYILTQYLGFKNAKVYDASMREWGNRDDTPLVTSK